LLHSPLDSVRSAMLEKCFAGWAKAIKLSKSLEGFENDVAFRAALCRERAHEYLIPGSGESNVNSVRKPTAERDEWRNTGDTGRDEDQDPLLAQRSM